MTKLDHSRHPGDVVSQSEARCTTWQLLTDSYASAVARDSPADVQMVCSIALAKLQQDAERDRTGQVIPFRRPGHERAWLRPVGA